LGRALTMATDYGTRTECSQNTVTSVIAVEMSIPRKAVYKIVCNSKFEMLMGCIITLNVCLIVWEADYEAQCFPRYSGNRDKCPFNSSKITWVQISNLTLLIIYTLECSLRFFVERLSYFKSKWNHLDMLVVVVGWLGELAEGVLNLGFLRLIRLSRLTRAFRILLKVRELYLLVNGVVSSLRAIVLGTCLLFALLTAYSILLVEYVHPYNSKIKYFQCAECTEGFSSVGLSVLTLFKQLIAQDSWIISFPVVKEAPWLAPIMVFVVVTVTLGVLNLILTVIVERAADARDKDVKEAARQKVSAMQETRKELLKLCTIIDTSQDGLLSIEELTEAYKTVDSFHDLMMTLDVHEGDLTFIFKLLDSDDSGYLDYMEFCDEIIKLKSNDTPMLLALNRAKLQDLSRLVQHNVESVLKQVVEKTQNHDIQLTSISNKLDKLMITIPWRNCTPHCVDTISPGEAKQGVSCVEHIPELHSAGFLDGVDHEIQTVIALSEQLVRETSEHVSTLLEQAVKVDLIKQLVSPGLQRVNSAGVDSSTAESGPCTPSITVCPDAHQCAVQFMSRMSMHNNFLSHDARPAIGSAGKMLAENGMLLEQLSNLLLEHANLSI